MLKLFKYEFLKTRLSKLIILAITLVLEAAFVVSLLKNDDEMQGICVLLLVLFAVVSILWLGLQSILTLHKDMTTRQSYMLFMTPNSSYKILGAKVLENAASVLLGGVFFCALGVLDLTLLMDHHQSLDQLMEMFQSVLESFSQHIRFDTYSVLTFCLYTLISWLSTVTLAYFAIILSAAILGGKKGNLFISFLVFLGLSILLSMLLDKVIPASMVIGAANLVRSAICLFIIAIFWYISAWIMDKYLSV